MQLRRLRDAAAGRMNAPGRIVLPIGANCQLGAALSRFGHHAPSLFRWADAPLATVRRFVEEGVQPYVGAVAFRIVGTALGTLTHPEMRARLADAAPDARVNTIVYCERDESYAHGVQLTRLEAMATGDAAIAAQNARKFARLAAKWREALAGPVPPLLVRLETTAVGDPGGHIDFLDFLKTLRAPAALKVVSPAGGLEGRFGGVDFVTLRAALPPPSDVMNVAGTEATWGALFSDWGVATGGAAAPYVFEG